MSNLINTDAVVKEVEVVEEEVIVEEVVEVAANLGSDDEVVEAEPTPEVALHQCCGIDEETENRCANTAVTDDVFCAECLDKPEG